MGLVDIEAEAGENGVDHHRVERGEGLGAREDLGHLLLGIQRWWLLLISRLARSETGHLGLERCDLLRLGLKHLLRWTIGPFTIRFPSGIVQLG